MGLKVDFRRGEAVPTKGVEFFPFPKEDAGLFPVEWVSCGIEVVDDKCFLFYRAGGSKEKVGEAIDF